MSISRPQRPAYDLTTQPAKLPNRTFVCLECRISRRALTAAGKPHRLRCSQCQSSLIELPQERRIPTKDDSKGWKELTLYLERLKKAVVATPILQEKKTKGIHSLFQLPTRKRR